MFEGALLDRHLRGCPSCRAFAAQVVGQTQLLRAAPLEELERGIEPELPVPRRRRVRAAAITFAGTAAAAVAAAVLVGHPVGHATPSSHASARAVRTRFLVDLGAQQGLPVLTARQQRDLQEADAVRGVYSQPA